MIDQKTPDPWDYLAEFIEGNAVRPPGGQQVGPPRYPLVPSVAKELRGIVEAGKRALAAERAQHQQALIDQRVIGHAEGQAHTIADVNAGRVDDLIAPRLAQRDKTIRQQAEQIDRLSAQVEQMARKADDTAAYEAWQIALVENATLRAERDAAQQEIATLTQELSVSRANHIDANQRNMQSVRELEAAEARCATLQGAVAADEERLRQAAARAGVLFVGCDTADVLADRCATLTAALEQLRDCDWTIGRGDRMDAVRDIARNALSGVPTP